MTRGIVVDLFAGGGGASVGIEAALGRRVDLAINHDATALAVHRANHPETEHLEADIWEVRPLEATRGRAVDVLWASPDCTHFSVAKGNVPRSSGIRSLAWVVVDWAREVRPWVIFLENVREFRTWGPLGEDGRPDRARMGETFRLWLERLEHLGYVVDYRVLDASLYGAPTRRHRLFLIARRDGRPIVWPTPTHGTGLFVEPLRTAAECIDWSIPCPSIFERKRPLAEKTLWRIAEGIKRFVLESSAPFIVEMNHSNAPRSVRGPLGVVTTQHNRFNLVAPTLVQTGYGERPDLWRCGACGFEYDRGDLPTCGCSKCGSEDDPILKPGQRARYLDIGAPLGTCVDGQKHALVAAFLDRHFGDRGRGETYGVDLGNTLGAVTARDHHSLAAATLLRFNHDDHGLPLTAPLPTVTADSLHLAEVRAFLTAYYGEDGTSGQSLRDPARTITARHRLGLVTVAGADYQIVDIGMRMLEPHELLRAQFGRFAEAYDLSAATTKSAKVRLIGNSVCPEVAEAIVRANVSAAFAVREVAS